VGAKVELSFIEEAGARPLGDAGQAGAKAQGGYEVELARGLLLRRR